MLLYESHLLGVHYLPHKIRELLLYYELKSRILDLYRLGMNRIAFFFFFFKREEYKQIMSQGPVRGVMEQ